MDFLISVFGQALPAALLMWLAFILAYKSLINFKLLLNFRKKINVLSFFTILTVFGLCVLNNSQNGGLMISKIALLPLIIFLFLFLISLFFRKKINTKDSID